MGGYVFAHQRITKVNDATLAQYGAAAAGAGSGVLLQLLPRDGASLPLLSVVVKPQVGFYRAPSWLRERAADEDLRWRVVAIGREGSEIAETPWRTLRWGASTR